jgi:predicted dehydrogenase
LLNARAMSPHENTLDRRGFLRTATGSLALLLSRRGLSAAQAPVTAPPAGPPLNVGVIGLGAWGRDILAALGRTPSTRVAAICDSYQPFLKRAAAPLPQAFSTTEWRRLLESADVEAVVIATPTHLHREMALAALQAGKHVYCEAPLAASVEEARAIVRAAADAPGLIVQAGMQGRSNALYAHVHEFVKSNVLGNVALVNAQWSRKDSWRRAAPTPEREAAINWRLADGSPGLMGEVGIHQLDLMSLYLGSRPTAVIGMGAIATWRDGRKVPDTATCVLEFGAVRATFRATLASSFGGAYTAFQGSDSSLLMKENRGWLIKEADSELLGWEVYARKETVHDETGIAMVAGATKLLEAGKEPGAEGPLEPEQPPLVLAFESFARSIRQKSPSVCGPADGYAATVTALKANEAVLANRRIDLAPTDYAYEVEKKS